jgi:hypothetical protein
MSKDFPTPKTDRLLRKMKEGDGVPVCPEWDRLVKHAREMERTAHALRVVATAMVRKQ